jgi:putative SbcD/Mre11-related phosphoesterase
MSRLLEIGPGRMAHASGALWLPDRRTAVVADLHLGYGWAQRRRGEPGAVADGGVRDNLEKLLAELEPQELIVAGDLVHAARPGKAERELIESTLEALATRVQVTLVPGNHDRRFVRDFQHARLEVAPNWTSRGLRVVHGHETADACGDHVIFGHLHPAWPVCDDAGAVQKVPVFVAGGQATILPAFSPFAGGVPLHAALTAPVRVMLGEPIHVYATSGRRVVKLGPLSALDSHA